MNVVRSFLHDSAEAAIIDGKDSYTYDDLCSAAKSLATGLIESHSVQPGDRVVLIAHNSTEFIISYMAILIAGAIVVPLDPFAQESETARDISLVRPRMILTSSSTWIPETYESAIESLEFNSDQWRSYMELQQSEPLDRDGADVAVMMMTAGASFQPRPAMLTHSSLSANLTQARSVPELQLDSDDVVLAALPMYHIFGLHVVTGLALAAQAALVISRTIDAPELATMVHHHNVTVVPGVPAMFDAFVRDRSVTIDLMSSVKHFISGGSPMAADVREAFDKKFGAVISEGYGLTEASPMVSFSSSPSREGDIGTPLEGVSIDVRDASGATALVGDAGQIVVKGANVFAGYYNDKDATSRVLDSRGWLFTGDIGVRNEDGSITLIDRSSDVVVVNGFTVFPSEVESVLMNHPMISHVSVVGTLDEITGEAVVAYIGVDDTHAEIDNPKYRRTLEKELREYASGFLARYKIPSYFDYLTKDRPSPSGRPLRKTLRSALRNLE